MDWQGNSSTKFNDRGEGSWRGGGRGRGRGRGGSFGRSFNNANRSLQREGTSNQPEYDEDGDLIMRPAGHRNTNTPYGGRPRGNNFHGKKSQDNVKQTLKIRGFKNSSAGELIKYIEDNTRGTIKILETKEENGTFSVIVQNMKQASEVLKLHGRAHKKSKIFVTKERSDSSEDILAKEKKLEVLKQFITNRFDPNSHILDFSKMNEDRLLSDNKIKSFNKLGRDSGVPRLFFKAAKLLRCQPRAIILDSNRLADTNCLKYLGDFFPEIKCFSLKQNNFTSYKDLEDLAKANNIVVEELHLSSNPLYEREMKKNDVNLIDYRKEICKLFPAIKLIDGQVIKNDLQFGAGTSLSQTNSRIDLPVAPAPHYFSDDQTLNAANTFLYNYFSLFDKDRGELFNYYDSQALFSLMIPYTENNYDPKKSLGMYYKFNRNLKFVKEHTKRVSRQYTGGEAIINCLKELPETMHPFSDTSKFSVEAQLLTEFAPLNTAEPKPFISLNIHGEFLNVNRNKSYSFDRFFIIGLPLEGSPAQLGGIQFRIISDSLVIRNYESNPAWNLIQNTSQPQPPIVAQHNTQIQPQIAVQHTAQVQPQTTVQHTPHAQPVVQNTIQLNGNYDPLQKDKMIALMSQTNLNEVFSKICLSEFEWDFDAALKRANELITTNMIPPHGFQ
ncbi:NTF2-like protein [Neoconidiobolus thromboides FSU 785]|nr:NTF2-like protein [Neoconidiobolus thromboides FSU 785]